MLNMSGSAMDLRYAQEHAAAVMQLWYPGARGGLVAAKLLFGELSPSGKLPVTFYNDVNELPDFEDYSMKGRTYRYFLGKPLYPFGYGLTYGRVRLRAVSCNGETVGGGSLKIAPDAVTVLEAQVENVGSRPVREVLQVYVRALDSPYSAPGGKLCGFLPVNTQPGQCAAVKLSIDRDALTVVDEEGRRVVDGRRFQISVGFGQPDERTRELTGQDAVQFVAELG